MERRSHIDLLQRENKFGKLFYFVFLRKEKVEKDLNYILIQECLILTVINLCILLHKEFSVLHMAINQLDIDMPLLTRGDEKSWVELLSSLVSRGKKFWSGVSSLECRVELMSICTPRFSHNAL